MWWSGGLPWGDKWEPPTLLFDFEELLLWNTATVNEDLNLIEVDLNDTELEAPPSTRAEDPLAMKGMDLAIHDLMATSL